MSKDKSALRPTFTEHWEQGPDGPDSDEPLTDEEIKDFVKAAKKLMGSEKKKKQKTSRRKSQGEFVDSFVEMLKEKNPNLTEEGIKAYLDMM